MIEGGTITVRGMPEPKPASLVASDTPIAVHSEPAPYVGRGGTKLEGAMSVFPVDPAGKNCLDAGASTGGFTDYLLQHGAARVVALDVGYGQLDPRLTANPAVVVVDRTNLRTVETDALGGPFELIVGDLSFISLCTVALKLRELTVTGGDVVMLVKPQFEVGKGKVGRGGVVRDPGLHRQALTSVVECFTTADLAPQGLVRSLLTGAKGNVEFFIWARAGGVPAVELEYPV